MTDAVSGTFHTYLRNVPLYFLEFNSARVVLVFQISLIKSPIVSWLKPDTSASASLSFRLLLVACLLLFRLFSFFVLITENCCLLWDKLRDNLDRIKTSEFLNMIFYIWRRFFYGKKFLIIKAVDRTTTAQVFNNDKFMMWRWQILPQMGCVGFIVCFQVWTLRKIY